MEMNNNEVQTTVQTTIQSTVPTAQPEQELPIEQQDNVEHPKNFFSNVMSVDETRVSVRMICLVGSLIYGAYIYASKGDLSPNWASVIETFAYCVTGINVAAAVSQGGLGQTKVGGIVTKLFGGGGSNDQPRR